MKKKKILVAEDEEIGRYTISLMLEDDYDIIFAEDGGEAVDKYFSEDPDLVLMDVMMPGIDGIKALKEIKNRTQYEDEIKIIAVTAWVMKEEVQTILDYGFDDFISKPIDDEILLEKINKYIR